MKLRYLAIAAMSVCLTSCIDDSERTGSLTNFFTITGNAMTGYTLYADGAGIVYPTMQSVKEVTGSTGFNESVRRGFFYVNYNESNVKLQSDGTQVIDGGRLVGFAPINVNNIMTQQQAEEKNLTAADSTFEVTKVVDVWAFRGFLNTSITANYSVVNNKDIYPSFNMTYQPDSLAEDELHLKLLYNRHSAKKDVLSNIYTFTESFDLAPLANIVPGSSDSVKITLDMDGSKSIDIKVSRTDFRTGNYKGFPKIL